MQTPESNHRTPEEEENRGAGGGALEKIRAQRGPDGSFTLEIPAGAQLTPEMMQQLVILQNPGQVVISHPIQINPRTGRPYPRWQRCGNCLQRLPFTGDPIADHHIAQKHRIEQCSFGPSGEKAPIVEEEHIDLLHEFQQQQAGIRQITGAPAGVSQRMIEAGSERRQRKPWWKVW